MFRRNKNIEIVCGPPVLKTGTVAVERATQTLKNLIFANIEDKIGLTKIVNPALKVMRFPRHTGLRAIPLNLHDGKKTGNRINKNKQRQKQLPIKLDNLERFSTTETDIDICGSKRNKRSDRPYVYGQGEKALCCSSHKSPNRRPVKPVSGNFKYPYNFFEKRNQKHHWTGNINNNRQLLSTVPNIRSILQIIR